MAVSVPEDVDITGCRHPVTKMRYEAFASTEQVQNWVEETAMKKITQAHSTTLQDASRGFRSAILLGLFVLALLFAPLGQGMGLSAGQGAAQGSGLSAAADALAASEVEGIVRRP